MKSHQIENWALNIIERIDKAQPIEDSRVELKADWIEPVSAARRLAGHANAARGTEIIWLIGVDEKRGVTGVNYYDFAQWHKQVESHFDEIAPRSMSFNIPVSGKTVIAILFETDRAPFLVRNPFFGKPGGGSIEREVPWREGTSIRSANRADLIKLLSPLQMLPKFEVLSGYIEVNEARRDGKISYFGRLHLSLYTELLPEARIIIPFHRCSAEIFFIDSGKRFSLEDMKLRPPYVFNTGGRSEIASLTIDSTYEELIITGSGRVALEADLNFEENPDSMGNALEVCILLSPIGSEQNISVIAEMVKSDVKVGSRALKWVIPKTK
jgi:hypothetical protein